MHGNVMDQDAAQPYGSWGTYRTMRGGAGFSRASDSVAEKMSDMPYWRRSDDFFGPFAGSPTVVTCSCRKVAVHWLSKVLVQALHACQVRVNRTWEVFPRRARLRGIQLHMWKQRGMLHTSMWRCMLGMTCVFKACTLRYISVWLCAATGLWLCTATGRLVSLQRLSISWCYCVPVG